MSAKSTAKASEPAQPKTDLSYNTDALPLWQIACELSEQIPEEEMAKVPVDASENLHRYLYGALSSAK